MRPLFTTPPSLPMASHSPMQQPAGSRASCIPGSSTAMHGGSQVACPGRRRLQPRSTKAGRDNSSLIPLEITKITGITDEMVAGHRIDDREAGIFKPFPGAENFVDPPGLAVIFKEADPEFDDFVAIRVSPDFSYRVAGVNGSHWWLASGGERCGVSTGASGSRHITDGGRLRAGNGLCQTALPVFSARRRSVANGRWRTRFDRGRPRPWRS